MEFETLLKIVSSLLDKNEFTALRSMLGEINSVDIAEIMEELEPVKRLRLFRIMSKDMSADVFAYLEPESQAELVKMILPPLRRSMWGTTLLTSRSAPK